MKICVARVKDNYGNFVHRYAVYTPDGEFFIDDDVCGGMDVLIMYEPADQFAHLVDMESLTKIMERHYSEYKRETNYQSALKEKLSISEKH